MKFTVTNSLLNNLGSPNGGQHWGRNTNKTITWSSQNINTVKIEFSLDNESNWSIITSSTDATTGSFEWTLPDTTSDSCLIRITNNDYPSNYDQSDNCFAIIDFPIVYVSTNGSDSLGYGTKENPYATIQKALENLTHYADGDSIKVSSGTYQGNITFTSDPYYVSIVGGYSEDYSSRDYLDNPTLLEVDGGVGINELSSNTTIDGLKFTNFYRAFWHTGSTPWNVQIKNCQFINGDVIGHISNLGSVEIVNCKFENIDVGMNFSQPRNLSLINCVFNNVQGIVFYPFNIVGTVKVINNTFHQSNRSVILSNYTGNNHKIYNNIFSNCTKGIEYSSDTTKLSTKNNLFYNTVNNINFFLDNTNIYGDPYFSDAPNGDFRLLDHSPAIGSGTLTNAPSYDYYNNHRPNPSDSSPDIGAIENSFGEAFYGVYVNLKLFLQGSYVASSMSTSLNPGDYLPLNSSTAYDETTFGYTSQTVSSIPNSNIVDWILVELRSGTDQSTKITAKAGFLKSDGQIVSKDGSTLLGFEGISEGDYYIVIYHRNHLAIMSSSAVSLSLSSPLYDFTTGQLRAYGTNPMKDLGDGNYGMLAGDANGDGIVDYTDDLLIDWLPNFGLDGYLIFPPKSRQ